jgi:hypothetical protein
LSRKQIRAEDDAARDGSEIGILSAISRWTKHLSKGAVMKMKTKRRHPDHANSDVVKLWVDHPQSNKAEAVVSGLNIGRH